MSVVVIDLRHSDSDDGETKQQKRVIDPNKRRRRSNLAVHRELEDLKRELAASRASQDKAQTDAAQAQAECDTAVAGLATAKSAHGREINALTAKVAELKTERDITRDSTSAIVSSMEERSKAEQRTLQEAQIQIAALQKESANSKATLREEHNTAKEYAAATLQAEKDACATMNTELAKVRQGYIQMCKLLKASQKETGDAEKAHRETLTASQTETQVAMTAHAVAKELCSEMGKRLALYKTMAENRDDSKEAPMDDPRPTTSMSQIPSQTTHTQRDKKDLLKSTTSETKSGSRLEDPSSKLTTVQGESHDPPFSHPTPSSIPSSNSTYSIHFQHDHYATPSCPLHTQTPDNARATSQ